LSHLPERTCAGCRAKRPKHELVRIVAAAEGQAEPDQRARRNGRGAYVCRQPSCWREAIKRHGIDRALHSKLSASGQSQLLQALATIGDEK